MQSPNSASKLTATRIWQGFVVLAMLAGIVISGPATAGATSAGVAADSLEAGDIDIAYTTASDRSGAALLEGAAISGRISAFVTPLDPDGDISRVEFSLDGFEYNIEFVAPYDFPPRASGAWDSASVTDGSHTLTIDVHLGDGSVITKSAVFNVSNGVTPVESGLAYSDDIGRSDNHDLNGAVVVGTVWAYVFPVFPPRQYGIQNVSFTLDGADFRVEYVAPYDFAPAAFGWDTTTVADGEHTIVATANRSGGAAFTSTATFTVANDGPPPTDPDGEDPDGEDPDGEDPDGDSGEPFDASDGTVIGRTGTLNGLNGINVGPDGNVYNASVAGNEITVHDPETGEILDRIGAERGVFGPDDVFITEDGTIYWTELIAGNVGMLKPDGTFKTQFVGPGVNPITMSDDGRLFVARVFLGVGLYELDPELEADPIPIIPDLFGLNAFDFGPDGLLYGPLFFSQQIVRIDVDAATPAPEVVVSGLGVPVSVKFNSLGELHGADLATGEVFKVDIATGGTEVLASFDGTIDNIAFDADDRMFIAVGPDNQLGRINTDGSLDILGDITLSTPGGVAVDDDGTVWVADLFAMRGYGDGPDPIASFYDRFPAPGTAFAGANTVKSQDGLLYTSASFTGSVQVLDPATGEILEDFRNLEIPVNAAPHGDQLVALQLGPEPGTGQGSLVDVRTGTELLGGLVLPTGLATDGTTIYVSDWATGTVHAVDDAGTSVVASGLAGPEGLAIDGDRLLVVETGLNQVSAVDPATGEVTPVITGLDVGPPAVPGFAPFGFVTGVTVDDDGAIYVTQDGAINSVLKFDSDGADNPDGEDPDGEDPDEPIVGVLETLTEDGRFTSLLALIGTGAVDPPPPGFVFTLFAPTDDAFAALPPGLFDEMLANPDLASDVLLYHLAEGALTSDVLATVDEVHSLQGAPIGVEVIDGAVVLNGGVNVIEEIAATEGVIQAIDAVLEAPPREFLGVLAADFARGSTEVPDPGDLNSTSLTFVEFFGVGDGEVELCIYSETTIADPTVAHIHRGVAGEAGGVVVDTGFSAESWEVNEFNPAFRFTETCVPVDPALADEILAAPGDFYFNTHSASFPGGANREQLLDAEGLNEFPRAFTAAPLLGSNEVPGPGDSDSGFSFIDFSMPVTDNDELCFNSVLFNVDEVSSAHIHAGAAGTAGDVVVNLEVGSRWPVMPEATGLSHFIRGCSPIDPAVQTQIEADPGAFYANFHNEAFPAGAVRAQLVEGVGEIVLVAELEPEGGGSPEINGLAVLAIFPSQGQLCWRSNANGVGQPTGISILGPGGFTIVLDITTYPYQENAAPFADLTSFGCQAVDQAVLEAIVADPDVYSVSIDTADTQGALIGPLFDPFIGPAGPPPDGEDPDVEGLVANGPSFSAGRALQYSRLSGH